VAKLTDYINFSSWHSV